MMTEVTNTEETTAIESELPRIGQETISLQEQLDFVATATLNEVEIIPESPLPENDNVIVDASETKDESLTVIVETNNVTAEGF